MRYFFLATILMSAAFMFFQVQAATCMCYTRQGKVYAIPGFPSGATIPCNNRCQIILRFSVDPFSYSEVLER